LKEKTMRDFRMHRTVLLLIAALALILTESRVAQAEKFGVGRFGGGSGNKRGGGNVSGSGPSRGFGAGRSGGPNNSKSLSKLPSSSRKPAPSYKRNSSKSFPANTNLNKGRSKNTKTFLNSDGTRNSSVVRVNDKLGRTTQTYTRFFDKNGRADLRRYFVQKNNTPTNATRRPSGNVHHIRDQNGGMLSIARWLGAGPQGPRNRAAQKQTTTEAGISGLHAVHGISHRDGGPSGRAYLFAGYPSTNTSHLRVVENQGTRWYRGGHDVLSTTSRTPAANNPAMSKSITQRIQAYDRITGRIARDPKTGRPLIVESNVNGARPLTPWGRAMESTPDGRLIRARPAMEGLRPGERGH